jgi:hypothetical protein
MSPSGRHAARPRRQQRIELGLFGIALHPRFVTNGFVYLYWT